MMILLEQFWSYIKIIDLKTRFFYKFPRIRKGSHLRNPGNICFNMCFNLSWIQGHGPFNPIDPILFFTLKLYFQYEQLFHVACVGHN